MGCAAPLPPAAMQPPETLLHYTYTVRSVFPHDPEAFTQGLVFHEGRLYESTGLYGRSSVREVALETGEVLRIIRLPAAYFGEGLALHAGRLIQLTWREQAGFIYDLGRFERIGEFSYLGEGWGLTHDGRRFIMSDGTSRLRFLDLHTLRVTGVLQVRLGNRPVSRINELEYVEGRIFANIWQEDRVAVICPESGFVLAWIDFSGLLTPEERRTVDVLNGIAYDAASGRLFVTGKKWPRLFEVELVEAGSEPYPTSASAL